MGKKILVAQLGVGNIRNSEYAYFSSDDQIESSDQIDKYVKNNNISSAGGTQLQKKNESCYPFLAYLNTVEDEKFTDLVLIGTAKSSWEELLKKLFPEEVVTENDKENDKEKVRKKLSEKLSKEYGIETVTVIIKNGITETEIMRNFDEIKNHMEKLILSKPSSDKTYEDTGSDKRDISIYLDISNAFRSVPMLVFATTNYLSVMYNKFNINTEVCCSVLESSLEPIDDSDYVQKYKICDKKPIVKSKKVVVDENTKSQKQVDTVIPMVDMTIVSMINQWSMAINEFYDSGSVVKLKQLIEEGDDEWFANVSKSDIIKALEQFSFAVNSNNLKLFERAVKTIIDIHPTKKMPSYISDFVNHLVEDFKQRFNMVCKNKENSKNYYGSLTLAIARWYADQSRFGDAVVALQEGVVTYVIENYCGKVKKLLKKRTGMGDEEADNLNVDILSCNDEYRNLISTLLFAKDENEDFEEYYKKCGRGEIPDEWREYLEKYDYICRKLRDPAMKTNYLSSAVDEDLDIITGSDEDEYNMRQAEENIDYCINKMIEKNLADYIKCKFKYLLQVKVHDFFISYRRCYGKKNGHKRALALAKELRKQNCTVWMDNILKSKTGEFTPKIREAIRNSRYFIVLLGDDVFKRKLYQVKQRENAKPPKRDVFYEEILTAYKHFKKDSDDRIIVVSFDDYASKSDKMKAGLFQNKKDVIRNHPEAKGYYDKLERLVNADLQLHPGANSKRGIRKLVIKDILKIDGVKENILGMKDIKE